MFKNFVILSVVLTFAVFSTAKPKPNCFRCSQPNFSPYGQGAGFYPQIVGGDLGQYANVQMQPPVQQLRMPFPVQQVPIQPFQEVQQIPIQHFQEIQQVPVPLQNLQVQPQMPVQQYSRFEVQPNPVQYPQLPQQIVCN